ncbi:MAG: cytochrome C biogenesis protein, partial [Melioribacteraceae bacterium]
GGSKSTIAPVMFIAEFNNSLMREPDILVGFTRDFYISPVSYAEGENVNSDGTVFTVKKGESHSINGMNVTFNGFDFPSDAMNTMMGGGDFKIGAKITVEVNGVKKDFEPTMINTGGQVTYIPVDISDANSKIEIARMDAGTASVELKVTDINSKESKSSAAPKEVLSVEASIKPFISLVWLGVLVMALGFIISTVRRTKESQI